MKKFVTLIILWIHTISIGNLSNVSASWTCSIVFSHQIEEIKQQKFASSENVFYAYIEDITLSEIIEEPSAVANTIWIWHVEVDITVTDNFKWIVKNWTYTWTFFVRALADWFERNTENTLKDYKIKKGWHYLFFDTDFSLSFCEAPMEVDSARLQLPKTLEKKLSKATDAINTIIEQDDALTRSLVHEILIDLYSEMFISQNLSEEKELAIRYLLHYYGQSVKVDLFPAPHT